MAAAVDKKNERLGNGKLVGLSERSKGKLACAVPTKCHTPGVRTFEEMMSSSWEEFVIRYDVRAGKYVTRTACCPGAQAC